MTWYVKGQFLAKITWLIWKYLWFVHSGNRETPFTVGFMKVSSNTSSKPQQHPPDVHMAVAHVSSGTQVWSHYYASLISERSTVIFRVFDSAPFSWFNYIKLFSTWAHRCCSRWGSCCCFRLLVWLDIIRLRAGQRRGPAMSCDWNKFVLWDLKGNKNKKGGN